MFNLNLIILFTYAFIHSRVQAWTKSPLCIVEYETPVPACVPLDGFQPATYLNATDFLAFIDSTGYVTKISSPCTVMPACKNDPKVPINNVAGSSSMCGLMGSTGNPVSQIIIYEKFDNVNNRSLIPRMDIYSKYPPILCKTFGTAPITGADIKIYNITYTSPKRYNGISSCGGPTGLNFWTRMCFDPSNPPNIVISNNLNCSNVPLIYTITNFKKSILNGVSVGATSFSIVVIYDQKATCGNMTATLSNITTQLTGLISFTTTNVASVYNGTILQQQATFIFTVQDTTNFGLLGIPYSFGLTFKLNSYTNNLKNFTDNLTYQNGCQQTPTTLLPVSQGSVVDNMTAYISTTASQQVIIKDSVSLSYHPTSGVDVCINRAYSIISLNINAVVASISSTGIFSINVPSSSTTLPGTYPCSINVTGYGTILEIKTYTFYITLMSDPCNSLILSSNATSFTKSILNGVTSITSSFIVYVGYTQISTCGNITASIVNVAPAIIGKVSFSSTTNSATVYNSTTGLYQAQFNLSVLHDTNFSSINIANSFSFNFTMNSYSNIFKTVINNLTYTDGCFDTPTTLLTVAQGSVVSNISVNFGQSSQSQFLIKDSVSVANHPLNNGMDVCLNRIYTNISLPIDQVTASISSTGLFSISVPQNSITPAGLILCSIYVTGYGSSQVYAFYVDLQLDICYTKVYNYNQTSFKKSILNGVIGNATSYQIVVGYKFSIFCMNMTASIVNVPSQITGKIQLSSLTDMNTILNSTSGFYEAYYTLTIQDIANFSLVNIPFQFGIMFALTSYNNNTQTFSETITYTDGCQDTPTLLLGVAQGSVLNNMTFYYNTTQIQQLIIKDSISVANHPLNNGSDICVNRLYTLASLTIDQATISISTTGVLSINVLSNSTTIPGTYPCSVNVTGYGIPQEIQIYTFYITLLCTVEQITIPVSSQQMDLYVQWNYIVPITSFQVCGNLAISVLNCPNFISYSIASDVISFTGFSNLRLDAGNYLITINVSGQVQQLQSFNLNLIDPCLATYFNDYLVEPSQEVYLVNLNQNLTLNLTEPTDYISLREGSFDGYSFCGSRQLFLKDNTTNQSINIHYDKSTKQLTINEEKIINKTYALYWMFTDLSLNQIVSLYKIFTVTVQNNTKEYFLDGGPAQAYTIESNKTLQLEFQVLNDCKFSIDIDLGTSKDFAEYEIGDTGQLKFNFKPPNLALNSTSKIDIQITEKFNEYNCQKPKVIDKSFILFVQAVELLKVLVPVNYTNFSKSQNYSWVPTNSSKPLKIQIESITRLALVHVIFNQPIELVLNATMITYTQKSYEQIIIFNWNITANTSDSLYIQCNFSRPLSVSAGPQPDVIDIYLEQLTHNKTKPIIQHKISGNLPLLIVNEKEYLQLKKVADSLDQASSGLLWFYVIVKLVLDASISSLAIAFQTLQMITAMPLLNAKTPANILIIFKGFSEIVNLQIVDLTDVYLFTAKLLPISNNTRQNVRQFANDTKLDQIEINREMRLLQSMNSTNSEEDNTYDIFIIFGFIALVIIVIILYTLFMRKIWLRIPKMIQTHLLSLKAKIMWSYVLEYMLNSYLIQSILCFKTISIFNEIKISQKVVVIIETVYLLLVPIFFYWVLKNNRKNLDNYYIRKSIGSLYDGYDTKKDSILHFTSIFIIRRLIFALTIAFFRISIVFQILITYYGSLLLMSYFMLWKPLLNDYYNFLLQFNEYILTISIFYLIFFTEFIPSPEERHSYGYAYLYFLYFNFGVNLIVLVKQSVTLSIMFCKKFRLHRSLKLKRKLAIIKKFEKQKSQAQILNKNHEAKTNVIKLQKTQHEVVLENQFQNQRKTKVLNLLKQQSNPVSNQEQTSKPDVLVDLEIQQLEKEVKQLVQRQNEIQNDLSLPNQMTFEADQTVLDEKHGANNLRLFNRKIQIEQQSINWSQKRQAIQAQKPKA